MLLELPGTGREEGHRAVYHSGSRRSLPRVAGGIRSAECDTVLGGIGNSNLMVAEFASNLLTLRLFDALDPLDPFPHATEWTRPIRGRGLREALRPGRVRMTARIYRDPVLAPRHGGRASIRRRGPSAHAV